MEGFGLLNWEEQLAVVTMRQIFVGLSGSANSSKRKKTHAEWTEHKRLGIAVDPAFRLEMIRHERHLEGLIQAEIDRLNTAAGRRITPWNLAYHESTNFGRYFRKNPLGM